MMTESKMNLYKIALLKTLNNYGGIEAQQQQLVVDLKIGDIPDATPENTADALQSLLDQDHASKRKDAYRGWLWKITPNGHREAARLSLEN
jgi:hypothetical protein